MPEATTQSRTVALPGGAIELNWAAATDTGRRREVNQDDFFAGFPLFVVADGMGGHVGGEIASASAIDRLRVVADSGSVTPKTIEKALQRAVKDTPDPNIDGLTRDQRFFLGFAAVWRDQIRDKALRVQLVSDPHSPPRIRANGTPANLPAYAAAFGCKPGDPMSNAGDTRVVIW